jgi:conjugal transfer mating pair stabilization protein TraG
MTKQELFENIEKGGELLKVNKEENDNRSRAGKALEATVVDGTTDVIKGAKNLIDDTTIKTPGSDGKQEIQNSLNNWDKNVVTPITDVTKEFKNPNFLLSSENQNPTNNHQVNQAQSNSGLADMKTQLEFIKDDLNEINSVNTQTIDKKGGKK